MSADYELRHLLTQWGCSVLADTLLEHGFTVINLDSINDAALVFMFGEEKSFLGPLLKFKKSIHEWKSMNQCEPNPDRSCEPKTKRKSEPNEDEYVPLRKKPKCSLGFVLSTTDSIGSSATTAPKNRICLLEIPCRKQSTNNFYDQNGHIYTKRIERSDVMYFRCKSRAGEKCMANVICREKKLNEAILSIPHNHEPQQKDLDDLKFRKAIEIIVTKDPYKTSTDIYNEAKDEMRKSIDMTHIGELCQYSVFIHRKKKEFIPLLPSTLEQMEELINHVQYKNYYVVDKKGNPFFRGVWRGPTGACVVFMSFTVLEKLRKRKEITFLMDGTFKCLPNHLKFNQLYIVNAVMTGRSFPLMYVLMERKDTASYQFLFGKIKDMIPNVHVKNVMTDYEAATRKAIRMIFPNARLSGCYFHYVQAIEKRFRKYGLNDEKFILVKQKVCALALLPNEYIRDAFEEISKRFGKSYRWNIFKSYWLLYWADANISVYGLLHRTNNFAESLNHVLNAILKARHPHIWTLIHKLKTIESMRADELERISLGHMKETPKSKKMARLNVKIENATKRFKKTRNAKLFLKQVTFQENLVSYFDQRTNHDANDSDTDEDGDIIPNNFNEKCNYNAPDKKNAIRSNQKKKSPSDAKPVKKAVKRLNDKKQEPKKTK